MCPFSKQAAQQQGIVAIELSHMPRSTCTQECSLTPLSACNSCVYGLAGAERDKIITKESCKLMFLYARS